jgi:hypothetical protein
MSTIKAANVQNTGSGAPTFKNSSGTEIGQLVKAWVNFDGSGTVAIRDDFNVASLTDNGTGDYTITFDTALANNDYALVTNQRLDTSGGAPNIVHTGNEHDDNTTTSAKIVCGTGNQNAAGSSGSTGDVSSIHVVVFGA